MTREEIAHRFRSVQDHVFKLNLARSEFSEGKYTFDATAGAVRVEPSPYEEYPADPDFRLVFIRASDEVEIDITTVDDDKLADILRDHSAS